MLAVVNCFSTTGVIHDAGDIWTDEPSVRSVEAKLVAAERFVPSPLLLDWTDL
jgi:hypothetical protein